MTTETKKYTATSRAGFFGAPISWVALFGALIGALSIVPVVFYSTGGGFISAGMALVAPACGILLGPWAGAVSGTIGGVIGMMISPGAYPGGLLDVFLSGTLIPLTWGLLQPKYRKFLYFYYPLQVFSMWFFPYYWPGPAAGLSTPKEPEWILSNYWAVIGLVLFIGAPLIWKWVESPDRKKVIVGLLLNTYMACTLWTIPYNNIYMYYTRGPYEQALFINILRMVSSVGPIIILSTVVGYFLIRAVRKGNLRVVPNSWIAGINFQSKP